jgi:hypothetical protein
MGKKDFRRGRRVTPKSWTRQSTTKAPEPPPRLLLGRAAHRGAQLVTQHRAQADAQWRELSESADYPDAAQDDDGPSLALQGNA